MKLDVVMNFLKKHPCLLTYPLSKEAIKKHNRIGFAIVQYEVMYYEQWANQDVSSFFTVYFNPPMVGHYLRLPCFEIQKFNIKFTVALKFFHFEHAVSRWQPGIIT